MAEFIASLNDIMAAINGVLWHDIVLYIILATGTLFLVLTKFSPFVSLIHGTKAVFGRYDHADAPGAISHFQALSAALSATVGLGNIGGVAVAVSLGGPGAVFWMWVVGLIGMALKTTEVCQSMLYRDTSDPDNPRGGPMWVVSKGMAEFGPKWVGLGKVIGGIFCVTLLISTVTGGNMFQAWSVADVTAQNFGVPQLVTGVILAVLCGLVIIGGIKRIGSVAGMLVPFMCGLYLLAGMLVLITNIEVIPSMFALIFQSAFSPTEGAGAFIGGTFGYAFLWGMKRALFSNEAGQGSAPIAHSAARTDEPVREGIVAGLEPFIDTLIVCTITAMVILSTGAWNRDSVADYPSQDQFTQDNTGAWILPDQPLPKEHREGEWTEGQSVFVIINGENDEQTGNNLHRVFGKIESRGSGYWVDWNPVESSIQPTFRDPGIYVDYASASLTSYAFDRAYDGLGTWLVTIAAWLFAISTMISWSYYGEQGIIYLIGEKAVLPYKIAYCLLIVLATTSLISTTEELDNLTGIGTGVMLFANIPIMLIFAKKSMTAYHDYVRRMRAGEFDKAA